MRAELGSVQLLQGIFHIILAQVLHGARAVLVHIGERDVASLAEKCIGVQQQQVKLNFRVALYGNGKSHLPHVILQILPTASNWHSCEKDTEHRLENESVALLEACSSDFTERFGIVLFSRVAFRKGNKQGEQSRQTNENGLDTESANADHRPTSARSENTVANRITINAARERRV